MQKSASKSKIIFLSVLVIVSSLFCSSEPEIAQPERIIEIPIETQSMKIENTKIELPTLIPSQTLPPSMSRTSTATKPPTQTVPPEEWTMTPTKWIYKSSTPRPTPLCYCNRDYDCLHFYTQKQAQFCFDYCKGSINNNWSGLDSDNDGIACEELP